MNKLDTLLHKIFMLLPDRIFLKIRYRREMGKKLDLRHPKTMNEKLQWLKLYDRQPRYTSYVDKVQVKEYIGKTIGKEYVVKTLGVWQSFDEIDFDALPDKFVLKTNHSGGNHGVVICKNKATFDCEAAKCQLEESLKEDIFSWYREWPYKNVKPCIFAEEYLEDPAVGELCDYKFYCFDGYVDAVMICIDRQIGDPKFYFFDKEWKLCRYNKRGKEAPADFTLPRPENLDKMFGIAANLSKNIPFVRVDLYNVSGKIYFGELTFYPASGFDRNRLPEMDLYFGNLIKLPNK